MRQIIWVFLVVTACGRGLGQTENGGLFKKFYNNHFKANVEQKQLQAFAELNPQFFAFGGFGGGVGVEFSRFQTGFIYIQAKLTPTFRDAIFDNAKNLSVPKNAAAEVFANVFLRKDRKGFYAGTIFSYDWYDVIDDKTQQKESFSKQYLVARAGFRWFPLQDHFYIDGGYGVSFNLSGSDARKLGESNYSPKSVIALPFFAVGGRFSFGN